MRWILKILLGAIALFIAITAGEALSNNSQAGSDAAAFLALISVVVAIASAKL